MSQGSLLLILMAHLSSGCGSSQLSRLRYFCGTETGDFMQGVHCVNPTAQSWVWPLGYFVCLLLKLSCKDREFPGSSGLGTVSKTLSPGW